MHLKHLGHWSGGYYYSISIFSEVKNLGSPQVVILLYAVVTVLDSGTLICSSRQWTGFYMIETSVIKELKVYHIVLAKKIS